jgi:anti-sigma B factor antagonist
MSEGTKNVVIDLSKVKWLNSSGLGALMGALTTLRGEGGDLKLANTSDKIESLLMITKLMSIFETYETIDKAVAAFGDAS